MIQNPNDPMEMIRHDAIFIEAYIPIFRGNLVPPIIDNLPNPIQFHVPVLDVSKQPLSFMRAYRHKICTR